MNLLTIILFCVILLLLVVAIVTGCVLYCLMKFIVDLVQGLATWR